jgi:hypothetical protein
VITEVALDEDRRAMSQGLQRRDEQAVLLGTLYLISQLTWKRFYRQF